MAILRGFPPSNTISPSVRITEKDLSFIAPEQSFHRAGIVGFASKGPVNIPTLISTNRQLHTVFGFPHPETGDPYLIYASEQYLLVASELFVVRVADTELVSDECAVQASVVVPAAGDQINIFSATPGPYYLNQTLEDATPKDYFFRWRLNGVLASKTLVVLNMANRPSPDTNQPYSADELAVELNLQLDSENDGIQFYVTDADEIGVKTTFAYGPDSSLEFVSIKDALYGGTVVSGNISGLGTGMTKGSTTGSATEYGNGSVSIPGTYVLPADSNLIVVVDGTDNVLIDNVAQVIDLDPISGTPKTIAQIVTYINNQKTVLGGDLPGGWTASANGNSLRFQTNSHGRDARFLVKSDSTADEVFGFDNLTALGTTPSAVTGDAGIEQYGLVTGGPNTDASESLTILADSVGIEGNNTQVVITNDTRQGTFSFSVFNNGVQLEAWGGLTKDQASRFYVETYLALVSDFVRVQDNTSEGSPPANGTYTLTGGKDGIPSDPDKQDGLLIGNPLAFTGIYALSEPEQIDIDLIAIPGHPSTSIVLALLDLCQNYRMDCLAIIDPPFGLTVNEIVQWQNGTHPLNTTRFDSDFGALYWPWVKYRDNFNRVDVWCPPSGVIMATIARSDGLSAPWFAPAGTNRGIVPAITDVFSRPTLAERDLMYGNRNCINPIVQFADLDGFLVWGQKTLQRRPTALDRVNVRRLMFVCEKRIRAASRQLLFDPHDDIFRQRFTQIADGILREITIGRGINDYIIKADTELNTPDVIDRNEFRARIGIQPTRAAEFIFIEFSIHRTGSFGENADTF